MITFLLQWCTLKLPILWTLANRDEASSWLPAGSFHALCPKGHSNKVLLSSLVLNSYGWGGGVYGTSFPTDSERCNPFLVVVLVAYDVSPLWYGIKFLYVTLAQLPCSCMPNIPRNSQLIIHSGNRSVLNHTVLFVLHDTSWFWFFGPLESPSLCSGLSLSPWGGNRRDCFRGTYVGVHNDALISCSSHTWWIILIEFSVILVFLSYPLLCYDGLSFLHLSR